MLMNYVFGLCLQVYSPLDSVLGSFNGPGPSGLEWMIRKRESEGKREIKKERHGDPSSDGAKVL